MKLTDAQERALKVVAEGKVTRDYFREVRGARPDVIGRLLNFGLVVRPRISTAKPSASYYLSERGQQELKSLE